MTNGQVKLVLSDVDGTLVTSDKALTQASIDAVAALGAAGIGFAVTSGRPPRGMAMLVEPLAISTPIGGFNGGLVVDTSMQVLRKHCIPSRIVPSVIETLLAQDLSVWCYQGIDWYVLDHDGPHVARETSTCQFDPIVLDGFDRLADDVVKVVGVSDDHDAVARATSAMRDEFGDTVSATPSQPYYLDVTHPDANKGEVVTYLSSALGIAIEQIATIGDMPNDVLMFAHAGLSIAMGNADPQVQRAARRVTLSNDEDGFAHAIREFVLR